MAANSQHALDLLIARCAEDQACHVAFPQLASEWSTLRAGLATGITTNVTNPNTGAHAVADLALVGPSIHDALLTGSAAAQLPLAIRLAYEGKWDQVGQLVPAPPSGGATLLMADESRAPRLGRASTRTRLRARRGNLRPPDGTRQRPGACDAVSLPSNGRGAGE